MFFKEVTNFPKSAKNKRLIIVHGFLLILAEIESSCIKLKVAPFYSVEKELSE